MSHNLALGFLHLSVLQNRKRTYSLALLFLQYRIKTAIFAAIIPASQAIFANADAQVLVLAPFISKSNPTRKPQKELHAKNSFGASFLVSANFWECYV